MSSAIGGLKELHQVHLELEACRKQLENGPRRVAAHKKIVAKKKAEVAAQKERIIEVQKTADQKNLQFRTNEQHVSDVKAKLNQATSNKEFDIFKKQIDTDTRANATLEDEYLELLEEVDAAKISLQKLNDELKETEANAQKAKDDFAALKPKVQSQAEVVESELREAEKCIPTKVMGLYRRNVEAHGAACLSPLDANACAECFVELSPQDIVEVRSVKIVICKSCGRFLYSGEEG